jgi:hypothetical protein
MVSVWAKTCWVQEIIAKISSITRQLLRFLISFSDLITSRLLSLLGARAAKPENRRCKKDKILIKV